MEVEVKKSSELTEEEFSQIASLFEIVFEKHRETTLIHRQYEQNPFGYAWLSILIDEGRIVGVNSYVPSYYNVGSECFVFANSIDSMVEKSYRDFFNFNDMIKKAYKTMAQNGVSFVFGYPNDNSFPVLTKGKLMKEIGKMYTYCLPVRIGGIKRGLSFLNPLSIVATRVFARACELLATDKEDSYLIQKEETSYNATRYQRGDGNYSKATLKGDAVLYYKIMEHEGGRTAFIIDLTRKSPKTFNRAVRHLLSNHSNEFDLILYPGYLKFKNTGLIRLPRKFEPKNFNLTGKMLAKKGELPEEIWDIRNWDTNLSNYDLI